MSGTAPTRHRVSALESPMSPRNSIISLVLIAGLALSPVAFAQTQTTAPAAPQSTAPAPAATTTTTTTTTQAPAANGANAEQQPLSLDDQIAILKDKKQSRNASSIVTARGTKFD